MSKLTVDSFVAGVKDPEATQYQVLAHLKQVRTAFSQNEIYPYLGELVDTYNALDGILSNLGRLRSQFPSRLEKIDLESAELVYTYDELSSSQMDTVAEIITWALPIIRKTIDEGRTIFEFVDGHLVLEEVGILPSYVEEGYLLLPDSKKNTIEVVQYELSIFAHVEERYRTLKTTHVRTIEMGGVVPSPSSIKLDLVFSNRALPNPATYSVHADIEFPYESTILPIAKRKLMQRLFGQHGIA